MEQISAALCNETFMGDNISNPVKVKEVGQQCCAIWACVEQNCCILSIKAVQLITREVKDAGKHVPNLC